MRTDQRWFALLAVGMASGLFVINPAAHANIDLEWRPDVQLARVGQTVNVGLYAVSDSEENQSIAAMDVILAWDPNYLSLLGVDNNGPYEWLSSGFPDDSMLDGLNDTWEDGDAYYRALAQLGTPALATPEGLLVTTVQFVALAETGGTELTIPEEAGQYTHTIIYDGETPGLDVTGNLGSATVIIIVCPPCPGDLNGDTQRDFIDFTIFSLAWLSSAGDPNWNPCADLTGDGNVDFTDFTMFSNVWIVPCP